MTSRRTGVTDGSKADSNNDNHDDKNTKKEKEVVRYSENKCKKCLSFGQTEKKHKKHKKEMPNMWQTVMSKHIDTRNKIKSIADVSSFNNLLDSLVLSDEDKLLLQLHYLHGKDFRYIGDTLGYAESTIKHRHRRILKKLSNIL